MTLDSIKETLIKRFDEPLKDFYSRRILFWQDIEGEFGSFIDELILPNAKILKLTGNNNFSVKKTLLVDEPNTNFLVYDPLSYDEVKDDCFLDIKGYSEEFRADMLSMRMDEIGAVHSAQMRAAVKGYGKFFENKDRVAKLMAYKSAYNMPAQLHIDVLSVLTGAKENSAQGIIKAVILSETALEQVEKFGDISVFHQLVLQKSGYVWGENGGVKDLITHILITALTMTYKEKLPAKAQKYVLDGYQSFCYNFINDFARSADDDALYYLAREVENEFALPEAFAKSDISVLLTSEFFPCINECILKKLMDDVSVNAINVTAVLDTTEKRRTSKWFKRVRYYYDCLCAVAKMQEFYLANVDSFHIAEPKKLFDAYTGGLYLMDTYYRAFHSAFQKALKESSTGLEDMLKNVADYAENLYVNWYLHTLGEQWMKVAADEYEKYGYVMGISLQTKFYDKFVLPTVKQGNRAYVIISDAMRFEVAKELAEGLIKETKGVADVSALQGVFPSATEFGMAALLPHKTLSYEEGKVYADGMPTDGTANREKVLKATDSASVAVTYKDILMMKQAERRELVKNANVVYIYHNSIDAVAEKKATEDDVFAACEEAITEIKNLVRIITNELSGANIFITADHGFIYSYRPLKEFDKVDKQYGLIDVQKMDRRFAIADKLSESEDLLKLPISAFTTDFVGFVPRSYTRLKMQGGGLNFVHGGLSLQEISIPVVEFKNMRVGYKKFVETQKASLVLLSVSRKVSNSIFSLDFYQKEAVEGKMVAASYFVYMADEFGMVVSDKQKVICDKTNSEAQDRQFRLRFSLKGESFDKTKPYYLTIVDADSGDVKEQIEFFIDIAFTDDFGDF